MALLCVVATLLYAGLNTRPGEAPPYPVFGAAVGIYLVGIVVLQAVDLARRPAELVEPGNTAADTGSALTKATPASHEQLMAALTLSGADAQRARRGAQGSRRFSTGLFIPTALVAQLLPLGAYLYVSAAVTGVWQPIGAPGTAGAGGGAARTHCASRRLGG